ncbi:MAG: hypothetical protein FJZ96_05150 [Chloroflexi bacterium]|nr:hypothetical protein [Chloroflexota bacterium]
MYRPIWKITSVFLALSLAILACEFPTTTSAKPSVTITSPASGTSVTVGQEVQVISFASADDGVARVDLSVNGVIVRSDVPTSGNPNTYTAVQAWIPSAEGAFSLTVVVYDTGSQASAPATVAVTVLPVGSVAPPPPVPSQPPAPEGQPTYTPIPTYTTAPTYTPQPTYTPLPTQTPLPTATPTFQIMNLVPLLPIFPLILPRTEQVYTQVSIAAGVVGSATAVCPSGSVIVGGGFAAGNNMVIYTHSRSSDGNGWTAYAKNFAGASGLLNSYAICLWNVSGTTSQVFTQVSVPAGGVKQALATCPAGSVVTGGGYASSADNLQVYNSSKSGNGWQAYAENLSGSSQLFNAYAICLTATGAVTDHEYVQITVPGSSSDGKDIACPSGSLVTGGGFALGDNLVIYNSSMKPTDVTKWNAYARNTGAGGQLLNIYAVCLSFP